MHKAFAPLLASTFLLALAAHAADKPDAAAPAAGNKDYVILKVNGADIKKSEVEQRWKETGKDIFQGRDVPSFDTMSADVKDKFLRGVASEQALFMEAQKQGVDKSPQVVATFESLKREAVVQELLKEKAKSNPTDDELRATYDAHIKAAQDANGGRDEVHARHIVVRTKEEADAVEKKLKKGGDFEKLAKEKSEDKNTGKVGGDLGWFNPENVSPAFAGVLLKLKKGAISEPIKVDSVWYIIQLEDWRSLPPPPFNDVKEALKQEMAKKALEDYINVVLKDSKISKVEPDGREASLTAVLPVNTEASPAAGKGASAE
jgi:peptidyl-prolyl cis-trans isomerase C